MEKLQKTQLSYSTFTEIDSNVEIVKTTDDRMVKLETPEEEIVKLFDNNFSSNQTLQTSNQIQSSTLDFSTVVNKNISSIELNRSRLETLNDISANSVHSLKCDQCEKTFNKLGNLNRHRYSHKTIRFECWHDGCSASYSKKTHLKRHIQVVHKKGSLRRCDFEGCQFSTYCTTHLRNHRNRHKAIRFKCLFEGCKANYSTKCKRDKHTRRVHKKDALLMYCDFAGCNYSTYNFTRFQKHRNRHRQKQFVCWFENCSASYQFEGNLNRHIRIVHMNEKPALPCDRNVHRRKQSDKTTDDSIVKLKISDVLDKNFPSKTLQTSNNQIQFSTLDFSTIVNENIYSIRDDGIELNWSQLETLNNISDNSVLSLKCAKCKKIFNKPGNLNRHRCLRETIRFECWYDGCSANYSANKNLNRHIRISHTKQATTSLDGNFDGDYGSFHKDYLSRLRLRRTDLIKNFVPVIPSSSIDFTEPLGQQILKLSATNSTIPLSNCSDQFALVTEQTRQTLPIAINFVTFIKEVAPRRQAPKVSISQMPKVFQCQHSSCHYSTTNFWSMQNHQASGCVDLRDCLGQIQCSIANSNAAPDNLTSTNREVQQSPAISCERLLESENISDSTDANQNDKNLEFVLLNNVDIEYNDSDTEVDENFNDDTDNLTSDNREVQQSPAISLNRLLESENISDSSGANQNDKNSEFVSTTTGNVDIEYNDSDTEIDESFNDDNTDNCSKIQFECSFEGCSTSFLAKSSLNAHVQKFHNKLVHCNLEGCRYSSRKISDLKRHQTVHSDERSHKCTQCELSFKTRYSYRIHRKIHSRKRRFKCNFEGCSYIGPFISSLTIHMVSHSDERPYKCTQCDKSFKMLSSLRRHQDIHENHHHQESSRM